MISTKRLKYRGLKSSDKDAFFDIMGNKKAMTPIPLSTFTRDESDQHLIELIENREVEIFAFELKEKGEFVGFCAVLRDNEILYRLRPKFWGKGFGKEAAGELINYCFDHLQKEYITAEANKQNIASVKILNHFLNLTGEYYHSALNCTNLTFRKEGAQSK